MTKIHKLLLLPKSTVYQKDAIEMHYLCNQAVKCDWTRTDLRYKRITCKNCIARKKNKLKRGKFLEDIKKTSHITQEESKRT